MSNTQPQTTDRLMAQEIVLPLEWRRPYEDLEVYRLFAGPFYAGEVSKTLATGWRASSAFGLRLMVFATKEQAQVDIETALRMAT